MAVISFKCPNCDGELIFDPSTQKYKCEYCFSLFSQEELDAMKPAQTTEPQNADAAGAGKASLDCYYIRVLYIGYVASYR